MQRDTDIIGWFYRNGKRIPIRKGKGNAKTKSGWDKPESPYSGAGEDYQHLYKGGKKAGSVMGWSDDGDGGYNARGKDKKYLGNYKTRAKAQKAVENNAKRERSKAEARKYQASGQLSKDLQESIKNLDDKWAKHTKKR